MSRIDGVWTHGNDATYHKLRCRCDKCRAAHSASARRRRAARYAEFAAGKIERPHGDATTYGDYGCRCEPCTTAYTAITQRNYRLRKGIAS